MDGVYRADEKTRIDNDSGNTFMAICVGKFMMIRVDLKPGSVVLMHSHRHNQTGIVLDKIDKSPLARR